MKTYKRRIYDQIILDELESGGAVLVEGAKWCGKTTTCEQAAKSAFYIDEIGKRDANILLARTNPTRILNGDTPRLIDEWQLAPSLWDDIRLKADREDETGAYLLTGSSVPPNMGGSCKTPRKSPRQPSGDVRRGDFRAILRFGASRCRLAAC